MLVKTRPYALSTHKKQENTRFFSALEMKCKNTEDCLVPTSSACRVLKLQLRGVREARLENWPAVKSLLGTRPGPHVTN